jgi:hypothetical protein
MELAKGAGITAGLEIHIVDSVFLLVDASSDGRFAADVSQWLPKKKQRAKRSPKIITQ